MDRGEIMAVVNRLHAELKAKEAEQLGRSVGSLHSDADKLVENDLVHTEANGKLFVPWEQVQPRISLPSEQAA
jgi:hypothetical protein